MMIERQQGSLPSNTETNPKKHVNANTLRCWKQLEEPKDKLKEQREEQHESSWSSQVKTKEENDEEQMESTTHTSEVTSPSKLPPKKPIPSKKAILPSLYVPQISFSQHLWKNKLDKQFFKFFNILKKLHINIPFAYALKQILSYAKFIMEILSNKRKLEENETVMLTKECSVILQNKFLQN